MPGVPSGRGCEACRKQKKKCDQGNPACSRCTRLQISCIGAGQKRYTFKEQKIHVGKIVSSSAPAQQFESPDEQNQLVKRLSRSPSNEMTTIISAFASSLEISDPRYDINCYGIFLKHIPARLGNSEALDASAGALAAIFPSLYTRQTSPEMLTKYGQALKILRTSLYDPTKAQTSDTLCAIYLTMICQIWIGRNEEQTVSHGEVMAHILNALAARQLKDQFESELLVTLAVVVILEKVYNPRIQLSTATIALKLNTPFGPEKFVTAHDGAATQSLSLQSLARIPDYLHHPELHFSEIEYYYKGMQIEIPKLRVRLEALESAYPSEKNMPIQVLRGYCAIQTAWVLIHFLALVMNGILLGYDPYDSVLVEEAALFVKELLAVSSRIVTRRPLGASYIPMCLTAVWAWASMNNDFAKQKDVENIWAEYQTDFKQVRWVDVSLWIRSRHESARLAAGHSVNCGNLWPSREDFILHEL